MSQLGRGSRFGLKPVSSRHYDALSRIGWRAFERLIADYYRDQGFAVDHSGTGASSRIGFDGGIDLKLRKGDEYVLVQCKHENVYKVTHNPVHELLGVMANQGASRAILITSGEFTDAALEAGRKLGYVQLVDGIEIRRLLAGRLDQLVTTTRASTSRDEVDQVEPWSPVQHQAAWREPRKRWSTPSLDDVAIKVGVTLAFILFALLVIPSLFSRALQSLTPQPAAVQPSAISERAREAANLPAPPDSRVNLAQPPPTAPPTAQELAATRAEQARRNAETQRYLETVPEVTHYSYSPLDQNKDPPARPANP